MHFLDAFHSCSVLRIWWLGKGVESSRDFTCRLPKNVSANVNVAWQILFLHDDHASRCLIRAVFLSTTLNRVLEPAIRFRAPATDIQIVVDDGCSKIPVAKREPAHRPTSLVCICASLCCTQEAASVRVTELVMLCCNVSCKMSRK